MNDYLGPERRSGAAALEARIAALESQAKRQCMMLEDVHEWIGNARGFFKVLGVIGTAIKWVAALAAAVVGAWVAWKAGWKE